jgi:hypothetical protein
MYLPVNMNARDKITSSQRWSFLKAKLLPSISLPHHISGAFRRRGPVRPPTAFRPEPTATEILPTLYIADYRSAISESLLTSLKITHIVSAFEHRPSFPVKLQGALHVPIADREDVDVLRWFQATSSFIRNALEGEGSTENRVLVRGTTCRTIR